MEIRASHILVDDRETAEKLIKALGEGASFAELASEYSSCPSRNNCGDLGFFPKGVMVPEFETAAFKLKVNEATKEPVKTQFGYHVILRTA